MAATIEEAIYAILSNDAATAALVSDRIVPIIQRDGVATPFLTYEIDSSTIDHDLSGPSLLNSKNIRIIAYDETYAMTRALERVVQGALDGFKGDVTVGLDTVDIRNINWEDSQDAHYSAVDGGDVGVHSVELVYQVYYRFQQ